MKRIRFGFITILMTVLLGAVHAQETYVGILGGLHFADSKLVFANDPTSNHDIQARTLFGVGGFFGLSLNEYMSVRFEPMFLQKGGSYTKPSSPSMDIKTSQLELQLLLKAGMGEKIRPYIFAGPSMSIVLDANVTIDAAGRLFEGDFMKVLKGTEYGAVFGAGVSAPVWAGSVFIEGRYAFGFSNMMKGGTYDVTSGSITMPVDTQPGDDLKTMGFQIMIGYQLPLGGE